MPSKIHFIYGTMGSGKSLDLIRCAFNYKENNKKVLIFRPTQDIRNFLLREDEEKDNKCYITSRVESMKIEANWWRSLDASFDDLIFTLDSDSYNAIFFDEAQFLSVEDIEKLQDISYRYNISIFFYGLKTNFKGEVFKTIEKIISIADEIRECYAVCKYCGNVAKQNLRVKNNSPIFEGEEIQVGGNESYIAVCNKCFYRIKRKGKLNDQYIKY